MQSVKVIVFVLIFSSHTITGLPAGSYSYFLTNIINDEGHQLSSNITDKHLLQNFEHITFKHPHA